MQAHALYLAHLLIILIKAGFRDKVDLAHTYSNTHINRHGPTFFVVHVAIMAEELEC